MQQRARGSYRGIYENHICELRSEEELYEGRSSQLYTQLLQLRKDSLKKKIRLVRDSNSWPVRYRFSALPIIHCKSQLGAGRWISLDVYNKKKKTWKRLEDYFESSCARNLFTTVDHHNVWIDIEWHLGWAPRVSIRNEGDHFCY